MAGNDDPRRAGDGSADAVRAQLAGRRWPAERARAWSAARPWPCGFNFLPSTAVNFDAMWQRATFDETTIARELGWAGTIGFNSLRTNLPYLVWRDDPAGLLARIARLLEIASAHRLTTVLCLFDDCGFSGEEPRPGPQPDPIPGLHNGRAMASPGRAAVMEPTLRPALKDYVGAVLRRFGDDPRILFWDLYNEPGNGMIFEPAGSRNCDPGLEACSHSLMFDVFGWARDLQPEQPLTVGAWRARVPDMGQPAAPEGVFPHPIDRDALALSDLASFHAYCPRERMAAILADLARHGRPLMCTEWMARSAGSRIADQLPLLHAQRVGAWQWGLVRGRTQTHIPWPDLKLRLAGYDEATSEWFHDLLDERGVPCVADEVRLIRELSAAAAEQRSGRAAPAA